MRRTFIPRIAPPEAPHELAWWFVFMNGKLLTQQAEGTAQVPQLNSLNEIGLVPIRTQYLGTLDHQPCYSAELPNDTVSPEGMAFAACGSSTVFWTKTCLP